jgi:hypothetical protein
MRRLRISELVVGFLLGFAALLVIFILSSDVATHYNVCETSREGAKECAKYGLASFALHEIGAALDSNNGLITAIATVFIAWFTFSLRRSTDKLWNAGERQIALARESADIARQAMVAGERAFVFANGIAPFFSPGEDGNLYWRFRPKWKNSGDTPTRNMTMQTSSVWRESELEADFVFDDPLQKVGTALIPPNTETLGGVAPKPDQPAVTPNDILDIQAGKKFLYLVGWARYSDIFPETEQHITRFCWLVSVTGDPFKPVGPKAENIVFGYVHHIHGNCADDECYT